jgi:hypothetical protein
MPLPFGIKVGNLDYGPQITGAVGVAAGLAVPVVPPVDRVLIGVVAELGNALLKPRCPPATVEALE